MTLESLRPLADHLWQSTCFAALAGLLTLALRKNRARVRHGVWLAALCKFLIPVSVLITLGGHFASLVPAPASTAMGPIAQAAVLAVANQVSQPFASSVPVSPLIEDAPPPAISYGLDDLVPIALLGIWGFGCIGIACSWFVRWRRVRALVRTGSRVDLDFPIRAASSPGLMEPGVFGIIRPALLLPEGIAAHLPPAQLKAVVAHELCHVRHRDNLAAAFQMFIETVYWFHPLVWWIGKRMVEERERACDEEVLQQGNRPRDYAEGILNVCRLYVESPLTCVSGVTGADLKRRIHGIVSGGVARDLSLVRRAGLAAAGTACLVAPVLIGLWNTSLIRGQSPVVHAIPAATVRYRSVTITPCPSSGFTGVDSPSPGRLVLTCESVEGLIRLAYLNIKDLFPPAHPTGLETVITGSPAALSEAHRFNIDARADAHATLESMEGPMLRALLEDRFKLKIHGESRPVPLFSLTVAKGGPKLQRADAASCGKSWPRGVLRPPPPPPPPGNCVASGGASGHYTVRCPSGGPVAALPCASFVGATGQYMQIEAEASSLPDFASLLTGPMGAAVIDKTGITGTYHFHLEFGGKQTPGALGQLYPPLPEVVEKAFGLKLERSAGAREFLVVDQVEMPRAE